MNIYFVSDNDTSFPCDQVVITEDEDSAWELAYPPFTYHRGAERHRATIKKIGTAVEGETPRVVTFCEFC